MGGRFKERLVVGFMGIESGLGTTHLAVSMANYIALTERRKVLYVELSKMGYIENMNPFEDDCDEFVLNRVVYWPRQLLGDMTKIYQSKYEYIVIDFGRYCDAMWGEFLRCDRKFMVGSFAPWRIKNTEDFIKEHYNKNQKKEALLINGINRVEKEIMNKKYEIIIKTIPYISNPMRPDSQWPEFFHELLF